MWMGNNWDLQILWLEHINAALWLSRDSLKLPKLCYGTTHSGYGTTPVGCRGGNLYVEGDLLTFGYLMLDDYLPP